MNFLKCRSGTSALPVAQEVDCVFQLVAETNVCRDTEKFARTARR
jgi:hypothetical protein